MITKNSSGQTLSNTFISAITDDNSRYDAKLFLNSVEIDCSVNRLTITKGSCGSTEAFSIGNVVGNTLVAEVQDITTTVKGKDIEVRISVTTGDTFDEYVTLGVFTVSEVKQNVYSSTITAYGATIARTGDAFVPPATKTLANIASSIATSVSALAGRTVSVSFGAGITTSKTITANMDGLTVYDALQILASVVGGFAVDTYDGNIKICRFSDSPNLNRDTNTMVKVPLVEEEDFEIDGVLCVVEPETTTESGTVIPAVQYPTNPTGNENLVLQNRFVTQDLYNSYLATLDGYTYRPATIGLTYGDPRLEGDDVLSVEDVNGDEYVVPCHLVTHVYSGAFSTEVVSASATAEALDVASAGGSLSDTLSSMTANTISAKLSAESAKESADSASQSATTAYNMAQSATQSASEALTQAQSASQSAQSASQSASQALTQAQNATTYANSALGQLSMVEDVLNTVTWIAEHGEYEHTSDTSIVSGKTYFTVVGTAVASPIDDEIETYYEKTNNIYAKTTDTSVVSGKTYYTVVGTPVPTPVQADIGTYYELVVDDALASYVQSHLALTNDGLYVTADGSAWKVLIADDGVYIIDDIGNVVAKYKSDITVGVDDGTQSHQKLDYHSFKMIDKNGITYVHFSDLRGSDGYADIEDKFTGDGTTTMFTMSITEQSQVNRVVTINGVETSAYTINYREITFTTAPSDGDTIVVSYRTRSSEAKAFTLGTRRDANHPGMVSTTIGTNNTASGYSSVATGVSSEATAYASFSGGLRSKATGHGSFATGYQSEASGPYSMATCYEGKASGYGAFSTGANTEASGSYSLSAGYDTVASGYSSVALGVGTIASHSEEVAIGNYNDDSSTYAFVVGNGSSSTNRSNALTLRSYGDLTVSGDVIDGYGNVLSEIAGGTGYVKGNVHGIYYGECSSSADTVAKTVTLASGSSFTLTKGVKIAIKFTYSNTATNPTLNVNSKGAKGIKRYGTTAVSTSVATSWSAGSVVAMTYDGTNWIIDSFNNTTYSGMTDAEYQAGTGTSNRLITPARLKSAILYHATPSAIGAIPTSSPANGITSADITAWNNKSDFSGSYNDLTNKPTIPSAGTGTSYPVMDGTRALGSQAGFARVDHVHPSDTSRVPTSRKVNGHALTGDVTITATDLSLATVATSGSYNDLSNTPTIPTVNNATLTIQKNGSTVKTFTANASSNVTANITVPTTASEVGALPDTTVIPTKTSELTNDSGFITSAPVTSVNSKTGAVTLTASDLSLATVATSGSYNDLTNKPTIPTQANAFGNVKVGSTTISADATEDTIELVAGNNVTITPDATNDTITIKATNTTYGNFQPPTWTAGGTAGLVPAPASSLYENCENMFLSAQGGWIESVQLRGDNTHTNTKVPYVSWYDSSYNEHFGELVTTDLVGTADGVASLDSNGKINTSEIPSGYANENVFGVIKVGSTNIEADTTRDTIELVAGSNITLTPDATNDTITIASTGGGGGGTSDYTQLSNKPSINSVTLTGNKSLADLGFPIDAQGNIDISGVYKSNGAQIGSCMSRTGSSTQPLTTTATTVPMDASALINKGNAFTGSTNGIKCLYDGLIHVVVSIRYTSGFTANDYMSATIYQNSTAVKTSRIRTPFASYGGDVVIDAYIEAFENDDITIRARNETGGRGTVDKSVTRLTVCYVSY